MNFGFYRISLKFHILGTKHTTTTKKTKEIQFKFKENGIDPSPVPNIDLLSPCQNHSIRSSLKSVIEQIPIPSQ
jgi:hypothetical protein